MKPTPTTARNATKPTASRATTTQSRSSTWACRACRSWRSRRRPFRPLVPSSLETRFPRPVFTTSRAEAPRTILTEVGDLAKRGRAGCCRAPKTIDYHGWTPGPCRAPALTGGGKFMPKGRRTRRKSNDGIVIKSAEMLGWALGGIERGIVQTRERLAALSPAGREAAGAGRRPAGHREGAPAGRGRDAGAQAAPAPHVRRRAQAHLRDDEEAVGREKEEIATECPKNARKMPTEGAIFRGPCACVGLPPGIPGHSAGITLFSDSHHPPIPRSHARR